jgi:hypothetical protein
MDIIFFMDSSNIKQDKFFISRKSGLSAFINRANDLPLKGGL